MTRMRIGIIGLGMASSKHALALADLTDRAEVVAAWSPSQARRDTFAATHDIPVCASLDAIFDDPSIGLVLILTPPFTHLDLVRRCVASNKHVLLEKPIEGTLERSEALVRLCKEAGIRLGVVFQNRCRTPRRQLRDLIQSGTLGRLISLNVARHYQPTQQRYSEFECRLAWFAEVGVRS